jgi:hypothetical protein
VEAGKRREARVFQREKLSENRSENSSAKPDGKISVLLIHLDLMLTRYYRRVVSEMRVYADHCPLLVVRMHPLCSNEAETCLITLR